MEEFRLQRYLARIGFEGAPKPDLATLAALHARHVRAIPFEGLDPLLRRPVELDLSSLQSKLVDSRRGGYCFEQNLVFKAALDAIGFFVTGLTGRVRWMAPPDSPPGPKAHMLLKVDLPDGPLLADVGFGACLLDAPLQLQPGAEQRTPMGTYMLTEADGQFSLSARQPSGWRTMYMFNLEPQIQSDYELGSWYASTNPKAPFTSNLMVERLSQDKRYKLANRRLIIEQREGERTSESTVGSAEELRQVLENTFDVIPPEPIDDLFGRLPS